MSAPLDTAEVERAEADKGNAQAAFGRRLRPLLERARGLERCTDVFVNGERVEFRHDGGATCVRLPDLGLAAADVRAAAQACAVVGDVDFGPWPSTPRFSVVLFGNLRVTGTRPGIASDWNLALRFLAAHSMTLLHYVEQGVMTQMEAERLLRAVRDRRSVLVSGSTGAGKTTLLRAMCNAIPSSERTIVLENAPELALPHAYSLRTDRGTTLDQLLEHTLREQPERIVIGEIRSPEEALMTLMAANTGHQGVMTTIHSNGARDALVRMHMLASLKQPGLPMSYVAQAVDLVLQIERRPEGRKLTSIFEVDRTLAG